MADYSMEVFIEDVRQVFAETDDAKAQAQAVCGHMTKLLQVPGLLDGKMDVPETGTATASLYQDEDYGHPAPGFWLMCNAQAKGGVTAGVSPHDHGASWVVYGVYSGAIQQSTWRWGFHEPDRTAANFEQSAEWVQNQGEVAYFLPGVIHAQKNVFDGPSVVVRLEGQKLTGVIRHRYNADTGAATLYG